jgi:hypothetical protein
MGEIKMYKSFQLQNLKERGFLRCRSRWEDNIKIDIKEIECMWTG